MVTEATHEWPTTLRDFSLSDDVDRRGQSWQSVGARYGSPASLVQVGVSRVSFVATQHRVHTFPSLNRASRYRKDPPV